MAVKCFALLKSSPFDDGTFKGVSHYLFAGGVGYVHPGITNEGSSLRPEIKLKMFATC